MQCYKCARNTGTNLFVEFYHYQPQREVRTMYNINAINRRREVNNGEKPLFRPYQEAGDDLDFEIPKAHELVMMDRAKQLEDWFQFCPGDVNMEFQHRTPLLIAIKYDSRACFNVLLAKNADIHAQNGDDEPAIMEAVRYRRKEMAEILLENGATTEATDRMGETITEIAITRDDVDMLKIIHRFKNVLEHDLRNDFFPLKFAIYNRAHKCVKFIINLKPSAQSFLIKREFQCPIMVCIERQDAETLEKLATLKDFANVINEPFKKNRNGETSYLHMAAEQKDARLVKILLNSGVRFVRDEEGNLPLHLAKTVEIARLLAKEWTLDERNNDGDTAEEKAKNDRRVCVYKFLKMKREEKRKKERVVYMRRVADEECESSSDGETDQRDLNKTAVLTVHLPTRTCVSDRAPERIPYSRYNPHIYHFGDDQIAPRTLPAYPPPYLPPSGGAAVNQVVETSMPKEKDEDKNEQAAKKPPTAQANVNKNE